MENTSTAATASITVTCPFCGLLCDDVGVIERGQRIEVTARGCDRSRDGFARAQSETDARPRIAGTEATLAQAIDAAAALLRQADQPLIGGMAADIAGARAAVALADRCGAVVDHVNSSAKFRNLLAFQDRGIISTTLAEVRNRADVVIVIGDVATRYPRLFERIFAEPSLFGLAAAERRLVRIGRRETAAGGPAPALEIAASAAQLPDLLGVLAAILAGRRLERATVTGLDVDALGRAAALMRGARYGVILWAAPDLDLPHAELAVQAIGSLLVDLNRTTRFAALPLGGTDGDFSADAVLLWQTGFPFRTSFATGRPQYDPVLYDGARMLERGEADALLWISTLGAHPAPVTSIPTIVLAAPAQLAAGSADAAHAVSIPVGVPGVDHPGHLVRVDKVVTLRLSASRPRTHPTATPRAAEVLDAIAARL